MKCSKNLFAMFIVFFSCGFTFASGPPGPFPPNQIIAYGNGSGETCKIATRAALDEVQYNAQMECGCTAYIIGSPKVQTMSSSPCYVQVSAEFSCR